jgi:Ca2+-binding RTX toxin-like protein
MSNSEQYYDLASLAEASYVLFDQFDYKDSEELKRALQNIGNSSINKDYNGHFSATQAADFVEKWEVISHQKNTSSGFSATLFKNKETGEFFYANRGTEPGLDDLIITDGGDIVTDGLAIDQIVDMYNDWKRIQATEGAVYQAAKLDLLLEEMGLLAAERLATPLGVVGPYEMYLRTRNDVIIDMPLGRVYTITMVDSDQLFTDERAQGAGIDISGGVTAVGHSLGGHLATAFSRLFSECTDVLTINGAGFMAGALGGLSGNAETNIRNLFAMLGGASSFTSSEILNLYGERGWEFTTMNNSVALGQQGGHQEIYIESISGGNAIGHGKDQMTDALAVYDLFIRLDQRFQTSDFQAVLGELTPIFFAMENGRDQLATYENIVNIFGELFVDGFKSISSSQVGSREDLYKAIKEIREAISGKSLPITSLAQLTEAEIASLAKTQNDAGLATRYALVNLNPFTITGEPGIYERFNRNGELDILSATNEEGDLSDQYIEDRAKFLYYLAHTEATVPNTEPDIDFIDRRLGISLEVDNGMVGMDGDTQYIFGSSENNILIGNAIYDRADHLYGMDGNDTLLGHGGDDYLEGGKGRDKMYGGSGNDTFFIMGEDEAYDIFNGGAGEDKIQGGAGDDTIRLHRFTGEDRVEIIDGGGGANNIIAGTEGDDIFDFTGVRIDNIKEIRGGGGNDTYIVTNSAGGPVVIEDNEGTNNRVFLDGKLIRVLYRRPDGTLYSPDNFFTAQMVGNDDLKVTGQDGGVVLLNENFQEGDFGITIMDEPGLVEQPDTDGITKNGDLKPVEFRDENNNIYFKYDENNNIIVHADQAEPGRSDSLYGTAAGDHLLGHNGNDMLNGKAGDDWLEGGGGDDTLRGEEGNDWLFGDVGADKLYGGLGNDLIDGGSEKDLIKGEDGDDILIGGSESDRLFGGIGNDLLLGRIADDHFRGLAA